MVLTNVRFDWLFIWEAREAMNGTGPKKFSTCVLIPKTDTATINQINNGIKKAIEIGITKGVFTAAQTQAKDFKQCLRDGDEEFKAETRPAHYKGHYFFNCASEIQPGIVGPDGKPIMDQKTFYSGCFGHIDTNFFPFNKRGGRGIAAGLNNIMKVSDGERLDGRQSPDQAFSELVPSEDSGELQ